jgi:hypothetical protein
MSFWCIEFYFPDVGLSTKINLHPYPFLLINIAESSWPFFYELGIELWCLHHFKQHFSYIVAASFIGGGNLSARNTGEEILQILSSLCLTFYTEQ